MTEKSGASTPNQKKYASRTNVFRNLATKWLRLQRPDVEKAIWLEVDKICPRPNKVRQKTELPASLEKLK